MIGQLELSLAESALPPVATSQRWRDRRSSYRPNGEPINPLEYSVAELPKLIAKAFVERHHYSGSYPAARERFGLYHFAELVGVAIFSQPPSEAVLAKLPCERLAGVELGRFVLLDSVPANGESWFLARCFELLLADGYEALISHSDPAPRRAPAAPGSASGSIGKLIMPGHVGLIYQATNAVYCGRTKPTKLVMLPDATVFSARSMTKIRQRERGYGNDVAKLVHFGAPPPTRADVAGHERGMRDWMWRAIDAVCWRAKHPGNHRYIWAIDRRLRRDVAKLAQLTETETTYPKTIDAELVPLAA